MELSPVVFFTGTLVLLWLGLMVGSWIQQRCKAIIEGEKDLLRTVQGALLTLFGLLLGFMFSMAVGRYEQRSQLIVEEANAIGTTWLRAATLQEPARLEQQQLLREYVPLRVEFLNAGSDRERMQASLSQAEALQQRLWGSASRYAGDHRDSITGLYLSALNESIDLSESRTAAFENRIPIMAWAMLVFIGFAATLAVGITAASRSQTLRLMLPLVFALALLLTFDLDSPRYGLIHTQQTSMLRVAKQVAGPLPEGQ
jgi:hypothetical protein